jgi:antitoxin (DNA-binding transcriptional repressor) of toxin-antitoxin stability system
VTSIGISEFKSKCIAILKKLHRTGSPLVVTHRGRPLVKIEAVGGRATRRRLGALRDLGEIHGDIVDTGFADDWESSQ